MELFYTYCAAIGGTLMAAQFLLSLIGFGDHGHLDGGTGLDHGLGHGGLDHHSLEHTAGDHPDSGSFGAWFVGMLSFRAIVAAVAVFGLVGLAVPGILESPSSQTVFFIAAAAGALMMYGVAQLLRAIYRLKSDGTVQIQRSVGSPGSVYLKIPGHKAGAGKVSVTVQGRTMEYLAVTAEDELATGSPVVVVDVVGPGTLEVARAAAPSTAGANHA
jgi:hypothetical protein